MAFPKLLQKLFTNNGAGDKLRSEILPAMNYVPLAGGTMTGTLVAAKGKNSIDGGDASNFIQINANGNSGGGQIRLHGIKSSEAGAFQIWANNGTKEVGLVGRGTGSLTWGGKELVTANQLATVATSGSYSDLSNKPTIPTSGSVVTIVSSSYDSTTGSWYRKWSDGYIEQGGITGTINNQASFTFNVPFSNVKYTILCTADWDTYTWRYITTYNRSTTGTNVSIVQGGSGVSCRVCWYGRGY